MQLNHLKQKDTNTEAVILLHGLARTRRSFSKMEKQLQIAGYQVINYTYPSRKHEIACLANSIIPNALEQCKNASKIHFVTHSMGGILIRQFLQRSDIDNLGRVVMLGPPNKGSQIVDRLKGLAVFKLINGPAGVQLGTKEEDLPNTLGSANFDTGIIAGAKSINFILSLMLPSPNDGKVSVESTKLTGMNDHIVLPVTHPFMMKNSQVISQVLHYLRNGNFSTA